MGDFRLDQLKFTEMPMLFFLVVLQCTDASAAFNEHMLLIGGVVDTRNFPIVSSIHLKVFKTQLSSEGGFTPGAVFTDQLVSATTGFSNSKGQVRSRREVSSSGIHLCWCVLSHLLSLSAVFVSDPIGR